MAPGLQSGSPWPRYHGNQQSNGEALGGGCNGTLAWKAQLGGAIESSAAIASDGTVYVGCDDDNLYAITQLGTIKWMYPTSGEVISSPAIGADGTVYFASRDGNLYAVSPSGLLLWSHSLGGATNSSPAVDPTNGNIYVGGGDGNLYAIKSTGILAWMLFIDPYPPFLHEEIDESPAIDSEGNIYMSQPGENGEIYEVNSKGTVLATATDGVGSASYISSPAIDPSDNIYYDISITTPVSHTFFHVLLPGFANWQNSNSAFDFSHSSSSSPIVDAAGDVYSGMAGGYLDEASPSNRTFAYVETSPSAITGSPALGTDGYVYYGSEDGIVYADLSLQPVQPLLTTSGPITASMAMDANGTLFIGSTDSYLYAIGSVPNISSVTLSSSTIVGGYSTTGTVTLASSAPANGLTVNLTNQWPGYVSVPATVVVPAGATTATFPVSVANLYSATFTDLITATDVDSTATTTLTVTGEKLVALTLGQSSMGGDSVTNATVTISNPAPPGGWVVSFSASTPSYIDMPNLVFIQPGQTTATNVINGNGQTVATISCVIHATDKDSGVSAVLTIEGDSISSFTVNPATIGGQGKTTATVTLSAPAPSSGWQFALKEGAAGYVNMPSFYFVDPGQTSVDFTINGVGQNVNTVTLGLFAFDANTQAEAFLTVMGDSIVNLTLTPDTVTPGQGTIGLVTLSTPAPVGGWTVHLKVGAPSLVGVPASITILAGRQTGTFPITTQKYGGAANVNVIATDNNTSASQLLTIQ